MVLLDSKLKISEVFLDPYNPRFINQINDDQEAVLNKILETKASIELMNSMRAGIKWVNKIVVIKKQDFSSKQLSLKGIDNCQYITVEGNNRLACLKSGEIDGYTNESVIPVLVAEKSEGETQEDFEAQLRITQGIANVMVVKEWSVISKARHLYEMYYDIKKSNDYKDSTPHIVFKRIAEELGMGTSEVRQSVLRYEFYKKINSVSDKIPEDHWGYLEAFDRTKEIREKFGMNPMSNIFNDNEDDYIDEVFKELPMMIKKAAHEGVNTKQFRDIVGALILNIDNSEKMYDFVREITVKDSDFSFRRAIEQIKQISDKDKWTRDLKDMKAKISLFPIMADWSVELKGEIAEITQIVTKLSTMLEM